MIRRAAFALLACGSCASPPSPLDPQIVVSPYYAVYSLRGHTSMQSLPGGVPTNNAAIGLSDFGQGAHDGDIGLRMDIGDGFSGFRIDYFKLDNYSSRRGVLADNWGSLSGGDTAGMRARMDELRLSFAYELMGTKFDMRGHDVKLRLAPAAVYAVRPMDLHAFNSVGGAESQHVSDDGELFAGLRGRVQYRDFAFDAEYAISPGWNLGGDFTGTQQDLEFRFVWRVPNQDVGVFAGYRRALLSTSGNSNGQDFKDELVMDGLQFGLAISF
jgi:hypothetical protein